MKKIGFIVLVSILTAFIFLSQIKLASRPVYENDEGIYLTSFLLIDKGHPAYKETFFSQPPGFLLTAYPGFALFGKTLIAARLTVGFWSVVGLLTILWISFELGNKLIGILTIGILYLIRYYTNQTLTFQSDIIVTTFSLLSLVSVLRYFKSQKLTWFIMAVFFLNFAFWTKFDITLVPVFAVSLLYLIKVLLRKEKRSSLRLTLTFFAVSVIFFLIFILPFGLKEVFNDSIMLRFQAINQKTNFWLLFDYLKKDIILLSVLLGTFLLGFISKKEIKFSAIILVVWTFSSFVFFFFYRPLFAHHLVILSVPTALLFSYLLYLLIRSNKKIFITVVFSVLAISMLNYINIVLKSPPKILNKEQQKAVEIILENTSKNDLVVSDEAILNAVSGRLPPPELSDVSYVRIYSNNLSPQKFKEIIIKYKPKLIISWNGRLRSIKNFNSVLENYKKLASFKGSQDIFFLK
ncbi:MAG: glycosyltransferase family 39 protein [Candidatus Roizmanbacteria bacterium]